MNQVQISELKNLMYALRDETYGSPRWNDRRADILAYLGGCLDGIQPTTKIDVPAD